MADSVSIQNRKTYSEVYAILNMLGEYYIEKLPEVMYKNIVQLRLEEYNPKYDETKSLKSQHLSRDAISMIAFFHLSYWCEDNEEKLNLKKIIKVNGVNKDVLDKKEKITSNMIEEEKTIKYDKADISTKNDIKQNSDEISKSVYSNNLPVEVKNENIIKRIIGYIKKFLNKKDKN